MFKINILKNVQYNSPNYQKYILYKYQKIH